jgi:hypothetical protein
VRDDEAQVRGWFDGYLDVFGSLARGERSDVEAVLPFFTVPVSMTNSRGHLLHVAASDLIRAYLSLTSELREAGYDRSVADRIDVRVLNQRAATLEAHGARIDRDGQQIARFGGFFVVVRADEVWRCTAVVDLSS